MIDVDAFALHNAFEHNYPEAMEGIVALVNVGHEATNVNILEDGGPHSHPGYSLRIPAGERGSPAGTWTDGGTG